MHLDLALSEQIEVLDRFYDKLIKSGHKHENIRILFIEALLKFNNMVRKSQLPKDNPDFKPSYLNNDYEKVERGIQKHLRKFNWYDPSSNSTDSSWKNDISYVLREKSDKFGQRMQNVAPTTVIFVPNSNDGILTKKIATN